MKKENIIHNKGTSSFQIIVFLNLHENTEVLMRIKEFYNIKIYTCIITDRS